MDLRKKLLLKVPLRDNSFNSPNTSIYESAGEDSDSESMYFSFTSTSTSMKDFEDAYIEKGEMEFDLSQNINNKEQGDLESSPTSDTEGKDDTVINIEFDTTMGDCDESKLEESNKENMSIKKATKLDVKIEPSNNDIQADNAVSQVQTPEQEIVTAKTENNEKSKFREPLKSLRISSLDEDLIDAEEPPENMDIDAPFNANVPSKILIQETISAVEILIQDPNENVINPFTLSSSDSPTPITDTASLMKSAKKSNSKIPTRRSHFYSPLQRTSIDRKTKIIIKPTVVRRTVYETRQTGSSSIKTQLTKSTSSTKLKPSVSATKSSTTASTSTKPTIVKPPTAKPKLVLATFKCSFPNCNREFRSGVAYQAHIKSHNSSSSVSSSGSATSSTSSSFKCKWCDKCFELSLAMTNHLIEACTKIPFGERRKLIAEQEKNKPINNKRKSMFLAPEPVIRRKSPRRQTIVPRKSGVVTPKKTMKCHVDGCGQLFTDVLAFANHMVSHKYDGVLSAATKSKA